MSRLTKAEQRVMKAAQALGTAHARLNEEQRQMELTEKKKRDKRLVHLGIVVEQQVKRDESLLARIEAGVRETFANRPHVLEAFDLDVGDQTSWFDQVRQERVGSEDKAPAAAAPVAAPRPGPGQAVPTSGQRPPPNNGPSGPSARGAPLPPASPPSDPRSNG